MSFFGDANLVVALATVLFIAVLVYFKAPQKIAALLDSRAERIRTELEDARRLREEAQTILASYERKHKEVEEMAKEIVDRARAEATRAAEQGKIDLEASIVRRLKSAEEQIASAEASAMKEVRDRAVVVAVAAARDVIARNMTEKASADLIDKSIANVGAKLH
ncbi:ATP F0F1 synthase subunit B [Pikeienuella sp. HZG-20]|uniref:F0F1 ATP synthase subunit B family protein n=1 Tax=Paludibacillus litoralis TaxID=3133267 RepID=UPI0030EB7C5C